MRFECENKKQAKEGKRKKAKRTTMMPKLKSPCDDVESYFGKFTRILQYSLL